MSQKYHINAEGVPAPCRATRGNCPYGGADGQQNHYDSLEEAEAAAKEQNAAKYGLFKDNPHLSSNANEEAELQREFEEEYYYPSHEVGADARGYFELTSTLDKSKPVDKKIIDTFGEDTLITEIKSDDPMDYSLDSHNDGVLVGHNEMFNELKEEGHDLSSVYSDEDNYEYTDDFRRQYGEHLKAMQGPTKTLFGREFAAIDSPNAGESTKQFVEDYLRNQKDNQRSVAEVTPEMQEHFENDTYYPNHEFSWVGNTFYQRTSIQDNDVDKAFAETFGEDRLVAEINSDDPLSYSLHSADDGMVEGYRGLIDDVRNDGYDVSKLYKDEEIDDYSDDFKNSYRHYLKSRQGKTKEIFGRKFATVVDPYTDKGVKQFIKRYLDNRK